MAYVLEQKHFKDAISGKTDGSQIISLSGAGGAPVTSQPATPATVEQSADAPAPSTQPAGDSLGYGTGTLGSQILSPITQGLQTGREGLGGAIDTFYEQAGQDRTWANSGAQDALQGYLQTGEGADTAKNYVNAAYGGPTGLDYTPNQDLRTRAQAATTGSGLTGLVQESNAGLTPGMARFDAQSLWNNPAFRAEANTYKSSVDEFFQDVAKEQERAAAKAESRTGQEADIREQSRNYVQDQYNTTMGDISQRAADLNAQNQAVYDQYAQYMADNQIDAEEAKALGLYTPVNQEQQAAQAAYDEILAKYPGIANIPVGELTRDWKGHELTTFTVNGQTFSIDDLFNGNISPETAKALGVDPAKFLKSSDSMRQLGEQLRLRQRELDALFSSGQWRDVYAGRWPNYNLETGPYQHRELVGFTGEPGQYAAYNPLYFQDAFQNQPLTQLPDPTAYVSNPEGNVSPGATQRAMAQNTATDEERAQLQRVSTLLPELTALSDAGQVFEAAQIGANYERFLADQEAAIAERDRLLGDASQAWKDEVQAARDAYVKAKEREAWGTVGTVLGGVLGGPLFWAGGAVAGRGIADTITA